MKKTLRYIFLTKGKVALVDWEDYEYLAQFKWCYSGHGYASSSPRRKGRPSTMHRMVVGATQSFQSVDHINGDRLDNRRRNLRICTQVENQQNRHVLNCNNTSGYKGVQWYKARSKWTAEIMVRRKKIFLGYHKNLEDAVKARKQAEQKYFTPVHP